MILVNILNQLGGTGTPRVLRANHAACRCPIRSLSQSRCILLPRNASPLSRRPSPKNKKGPSDSHTRHDHHNRFTCLTLHLIAESHSESTTPPYSMDQLLRRKVTHPPADFNSNYYIYVPNLPAAIVALVLWIAILTGILYRSWRYKIFYL